MEALGACHCEGPAADPVDAAADAGEAALWGVEVLRFEQESRRLIRFGFGPEGGGAAYEAASRAVQSSATARERQLGTVTNGLLTVLSENWLDQ